MRLGDWRPLSTARLTLPPGIATVWWLELAPIPDPCWARWNTVLNPEEQARAARFVREPDRRQFIAAHALARGMLRRHGGLDARQWRFDKAPDGKPFIHPDHGVGRLQFNISHAPGAVACGLLLDHPLGIDIEDRERPGTHLRLADHYFAPSEVAQLHAALPAEQTTMFFLFWTLKEAYLKATGTGLRTPLDQFAFRFSPIRIHFEPSLNDRDSAWRFHSEMPTRRHTLSVAIRCGEGETVTVQTRGVSYQDVDRLTIGADCPPRPRSA